MDPAEYARQLSECVANGPTAEVLAELAKRSAEMIALGLIFQPSEKYLPPVISDEEFRKRLGHFLP